MKERQEVGNGSDGGKCCGDEGPWLGVQYPRPPSSTRSFMMDPSDGDRFNAILDGIDHLPQIPNANFLQVDLNAD
jgi:hypothetical protein